MWPAGIKWQAIPCWLLNMCWTNLRTGGQNNSAWATQDYPPYCVPTTKGRRSALQLSRTQRSWRSRPPREPPRSPRQAATARHQALPAEMGPEPTHKTAVGAARGGWPSAAARNAPPVAAAAPATRSRSSSPSPSRPAAKERTRAASSSSSGQLSSSVAVGFAVGVVATMAVATCRNLTLVMFVIGGCRGSTERTCPPWVRSGLLEHCHFECKGAVNLTIPWAGSGRTRGARHVQKDGTREHLTGPYADND